jgi:hypothetical protein
MGAGDRGGDPHLHLLKVFSRITSFATANALFSSEVNGIGIAASFR